MLKAAPVAQTLGNLFLLEIKDLREYCWPASRFSGVGDERLRLWSSLAARTEGKS
jgi:hypothetical protein